MSQIIQCPTCSKKFKLPERPPATFTCTSPNCGTVMDLSGFRAAAPEAAPAEPAAPAAAPTSTRASSSGARASGARRSSSTSGTRSSTRSGARAGARAGRGRGGDDEEDGGGRSGPPPKSNAVLIGSMIGMVVLIGVLFLVLRHKDEPHKPAPVATTGGAGDAAGTAPGVPAMADPGMGATPAMADAAMGADAATTDASTPEPAMGEHEATYVAPSKVQFHPIEHHKDASADERTKIDQLVQTAVFENAGRDSQLAGDELVTMGVKAAPRLINVFSTVKMGVGFDDRLGKIQCSVADQLLRRIDGYIERSLSPRNTPLKGQSDTKWVEKVARYWISWWDSEKYKTPQKPWNERIDGNREDAPEGGGMADEAAMKSAETPDGPSGGK